MTTKKQVMDLSNAMGVEVEDNSTPQYFAFQFIAPKGQMFASDNLHALAHFQYKGFGRNAVSEFWGDIKERLESGLRDCIELNCDSCGEGD